MVDLIFPNKPLSNPFQNNVSNSISMRRSMHRNNRGYLIAMFRQPRYIFRMSAQKGATIREKHEHHRLRRGKHWFRKIDIAG